MIERHKWEDRYKKSSKAMNIPWSPVKSIIRKWKECGTAVNLPRQAVVKYSVNMQEGDRWGRHQETYDNSEVVPSFRGWDWREGALVGCSKVAALWNSGKEKLLEALHTHDSLCGRIQTVLDWHLSELLISFVLTFRVGEVRPLSFLLVQFGWPHVNQTLLHTTLTSAEV